MMGNTGEAMFNQAQSRLMGAKAQEAQQDLARKEEFKKSIAADPSILQKLGITPEQYKIMGDDAVSDALKARMSRDPVQEADMLAQIKHLNQPKWQITGTDEFGKSRYDLVGPNGDIMTPKGAGGRSSGGILEQLGDLQGPAALDRLKQVNPAIGAEVEGIISARQPFPSRKFGTAEGAMLNQLASLVDPDYTPLTFDARKKARADYTPGGTVGKQITFANTGIKHGAELLELADKIPNHTNFGPLNSTINEMDASRLSRSGQGGDINSYKQAAINFMDEIGKALGAGASGEREKLQEQIAAANGPEAVKAVIKTQINLLKDKIETQTRDYKTVMGPMAGNVNFIHPEAQAALDKIYGGKDQLGGGNSTLEKAKRILGQ
jgi:hypothetical protein